MKSISTQNLSNDSAKKKLLSFFEKTVFFDEYDDERDHSRIRKWIQPIIIKLHGKSAKFFQNDIEEYGLLFASLTNLSIKIIQDQNYSNFDIYFVPWDDIPDLVKPHSPNPEWLDVIIEDSACLFVYKRSTTYEIRQAYIYVSTDEPVAEIKSCLLEEITQALGFPNDSDLVRPSVFNSWDGLDTLSYNDEILIRILYDSRIAPGMRKSVALTQARIILEEILNEN